MRDIILKKIPTLQLVVAAALLGEDDRIFLQRRPKGKAMAGLWEYPGGKLEVNETPESALIRELEEEIGVCVNPADTMPITFASQPVAGKHMILLLYAIHHWSGSPVAMEGQETGWFTLDQMADLPMPPADLPFTAALSDYLSRQQNG